MASTKIDNNNTGQEKPPLDSVASKMPKLKSEKHYNQCAQPIFHGRRKAYKLSIRKKFLINEVLPSFRIRVPQDSKNINLVDLFPSKPEELHLEIGFGAGEHLLAKAIQNPKVGFIGVDPFLNGVASLLNGLIYNNVKNIRIFDDDVRLILDYFPCESVKTVYILFNDPWPKVRHHKRRLVQDDMIRILANITVGGGHIVFASDHADFVRWTLKKFTNSPFFFWEAESKKDWSIRPRDWIPTRYEEKALLKKRKITYLTFTRTS
ncbi:MAG: tRNA (guanosine(46)-N7)-methyltransferase TrmB [Magnetovibrio sp.]|nr:tRNA (guanosine(46)-N7)-methyltransferase TrmB [Magnetovibrio sp.]|tara:strand:+ start:70 stop:861 length:792 start_codon:yes stop_codon:yes gene_type:complete